MIHLASDHSIIKHTLLAWDIAGSVASNFVLKEIIITFDYL